MSIKTFHITNGDSINERLKELQIEGDFAVWREMLCEGKTVFQIGNASFINARKKFLEQDYTIDASHYEEKFISQLKRIDQVHAYDEVILWFEYDLFCHINLIAAISYLLQIDCKVPVYLVCSGRVSGEKELKGLAELTEKQLKKHYTDKVLLSKNDLLLADHIWRLYCGEDHTLLNPKLAKDSGFKYLSNCISAHKERFPSQHSGLNTLETNLLKLIQKHKITSENQLCGYALNYQGYYGYGDMQIFKMIKRMHSYFINNGDQIVLTDKGIHAIELQQNMYEDLKKPCYFGGVSKYEYLYQTDSHQLVKIE